MGNTDDNTAKLKIDIKRVLCGWMGTCPVNNQISLANLLTVNAKRFHNHAVVYFSGWCIRTDMKVTYSYVRTRNTLALNVKMVSKSITAFAAFGHLLHQHLTEALSSGE